VNLRRARRDARDYAGEMLTDEQQRKLHHRMDDLRLRLEALHDWLERRTWSGDPILQAVKEQVRATREACLLTLGHPEKKELSRYMKRIRRRDV
jgi:hypothetical protein